MEIQPGIAQVGLLKWEVFEASGSSIRLRLT